MLSIQSTSQYDSMLTEQFNYAHPDAGFVEASVLDEEFQVNNK